MYFSDLVSPERSTIGEQHHRWQDGRACADQNSDAGAAACGRTEGRGIAIDGDVWHMPAVNEPHDLDSIACTGIDPGIDRITGLDLSEESDIHRGPTAVQDGALIV